MVFCRHTGATITINLPPATQERLRAQAQATGKDVWMLILQAVETRLSLAQMSLRTILAPVHDEFRKSGLSEKELDSILQESLQKTRAESESASDRSA